MAAPPALLIFFQYCTDERPRGADSAPSGPSAASGKQDGGRPLSVAILVVAPVRNGDGSHTDDDGGLSVYIGFVLGLVLVLFTVGHILIPVYRRGCP